MDGIIIYLALLAGAFTTAMSLYFGLRAVKLI
ncbi:MAG: cytochrome b6-f complex subunit PetL [Cyanobacteria bacterium P01_H01_bin.119]